MVTTLHLGTTIAFARADVLGPAGEEEGSFLQLQLYLFVRQGGLESGRKDNTKLTNELLLRDL